MQPWLRVAMMFAVGCLLTAAPATGAVTPEQRKELTALRSEVNKVNSLIRSKQLDDADQALDAAESKLKGIADAAGVPDDDRSLLGLPTLIAQKRNALAKLRGRSGQGGDADVVFSRDVAPIINEACLGCHGASNPRANLRLDTFAGWRRGGRSGPLLVIGNAENSLIMRALRIDDAQRRMPKDADPLDDEQLQTIATWINGGAKYDGGKQDLPLAEVIANAPLDPNVEIPKPKGSETVSFTRDIAPFMSNLCGGCHSRQRMSGGLCLESFYDMMKGGGSGEVVIPGDRENSRLFRLTGGLENPRMPQGQARITRKNYEDLKTWFDEGCVYDGEDPKTPLREFVRSTAEIEAEKFAKMSDDDFRKLRIERTRDQFKRALPNDSAESLETDQFYVVGNVSGARLQQVADWANDHTARLRKLFDVSPEHLWKGRLAVFVLRDRFSYDEFNLVVERREATRELIGHSNVTPTFEDAYVAILDVGDESSEGSPSLHVNLIDHLTGAFLKRGGGNVPLWVQRGLGLVLAGQAEPGDPYLRRLPVLAKEHTASLRNPADLFKDGTFSPAALGPVSYSLVDYMFDVGGAARFARFAEALGRGDDLAGALRAIYYADAETLARGYARALK